MLMSESLEIGEMFRRGDARPVWRRDLADPLPRLRHDLQRDAGAAGRGEALLDSEPVDLMIVVGGYNSSNTCNLASICAAQRADLSHRRSGLPAVGRTRSGTGRSARRRRRRRRKWSPRTGCRSTGRVVVGLTAGASTPNNIVGEVIETVERFAALGFSAKGGS